MTDYQIYEFFYLIIIAILTYVAIGQYKVRTIADFDIYYRRKSNIGYSSALVLAIALSLVIGLRAEDGNFSDSLNYRLYYYVFYEGRPF